MDSGKIDAMRSSLTEPHSGLGRGLSPEKPARPSLPVHNCLGA